MALTVFDVSQAPTLQPNILGNAGFEIWQRGTSFSSLATALYSADRWKTFNSGTAPTGTITQETTTVDNSAKALKINLTSVAGNGTWGIRNDIEDVKSYRNKTLTVSGRINSSSGAAGFFLLISDGITNGVTAITTTSGYATFSASITVSNSATEIYIIFGNPFSAIVATGTWYLDNFMVVQGLAPALFIPISPAADLADCQRYFQIYGNSTTSGNFFAQCSSNAATTFGQGVIKFIVQMRVAPTSTVTSPTSFLLNDGGGNVAVSTLSVDGLEAYGARFSGTTAGGLTAFHMYSLAPQGGTISFSADF